MSENLPIYIPVIFVLTTFLTIGFLLYAVRKVSLLNTIPGKILTSAIFLWMLITALLAINGFYQNTQTLPPRVFLFGVLPSLLLIIFFFIFFRQNFVEVLPLKILTLLSIIRIPIEFVLLWLSQIELVSPLMTFEGWNFDILSGISAPIIYWLAFRNGKTNRTLLIAWNIIALGLLLIIITIAFLSFPSPVQQISFAQPNRAVMFFPYIWLPAIVVPIVLCTHLTSLWKLSKNIT